ncbi:MAG TPA: hypothetical protein VE197_06970, partial [Mycobacterium sp.]|nr:hypothetical protein [Mycobacterium sp.]
SSALVIPAKAPQSKFMRYARAVSSEYTPLFPIVPAARAMVGHRSPYPRPHPADHGELVGVLRRGEVTLKLLLFVDDDPGLADEWMPAFEVEDRDVIDYTDQPCAARFMDAMEFGVSTMRATSGEDGAIAAPSTCKRKSTRRFHRQPT